MTSSEAATPERISLLESLDQACLKLPLAVMQDVGPAVQTLGGLLRITTRETYVPVGDIAAEARLPAATVSKHLATLDAAGWINNKGRQHTPRGVPRRTTTIVITKQTLEHIEPYGFLPWWACCSIREVGRLPWCAKAVLSVVMARLMSLKAAVEEQDGHGLDADDVIGSIDNMGGDERFRFSLKWLTGQTGLTKESVVLAKRELDHRFGIVHWIGSQVKRGANTPTDQLVPNWNFRVVVTPASPELIWFDFDKVSETGQ